jgi:hypothetical protein
MTPNATAENLSSNHVTVNDLVKIVLNDSNMTADDKIKLIDEIRKNNPVTADRWTYRWVVWFFGGSILCTLAALCYLTVYKHPIPDGLIAIGSATVGGLAGSTSPAKQH